MPKQLAPDGTRNLIGPQLKKIRKEAQLSQNDLASKLQLHGYDVDRNTITRIEAGTRFVSDMELKIFIEVLGVRYEDLFEDKQDMKQLILHDLL